MGICEEDFWSEIFRAIYLIMIKISHLAKSFGENKVLTEVNLNIEKGETMVIIGRSGCGKSVLLKHIIGLLKPDKGKIEQDKEEIRNALPGCGSL
jgi:ABC-type sugar transport system ATPase subunit